MTSLLYPVGASLRDVDAHYRSMYNLKKTFQEKSIESRCEFRMVAALYSIVDFCIHTTYFIQVKFKN